MCEVHHPTVCMRFVRNPGVSLSMTMQRDPAVSFASGAHGDDDVVRLGSVGDERFLAVDDVGVAVADGSRLQRGDVRSRARLGHGQSGDHLAPDRRHEPALALLVVAEPVDVVRRRGPCARRAPPRRPPAPHSVSSSVTTASARRSGPEPPYSSSYLRPKRPSSPHALVEGAREVALRFPLVDVGADLAADEVPHGSPERFVLLREEVVARVAHQRPRIFARISRMTSSAPPPIRISRVSRHARWIGRSIRYAAPPKICIALVRER